jgi:hypothetical protein
MLWRKVFMKEVSFSSTAKPAMLVASLCITASRFWLAIPSAKTRMNDITIMAASNFAIDGRTARYGLHSTPLVVLLQTPVVPI